MKVILNEQELGDAIIEFLKKRGVDTSLDKIYLTFDVIGGKRIYSAEIRGVELPVKEGPYR